MMEWGWAELNQWSDRETSFENIRQIWTLYGPYTWHCFSSCANFRLGVPGRRGIFMCSSWTYFNDECFRFKTSFQTPFFLMVGYHFVNVCKKGLIDKRSATAVSFYLVTRDFYSDSLKSNKSNTVMHLLLHVNALPYNYWLGKLLLLWQGWLN